MAFFVSSNQDVSLNVNNSLTKNIEFEKLLAVKGCVRYIFANLFCMSKREHL